MSVMQWIPTKPQSFTAIIMIVFMQYLATVAPSNLSQPSVMAYGMLADVWMMPRTWV